MRLCVIGCALVAAACGRLEFDPRGTGDDDGGVTPCDSSSPRLVYRSIGTSTATHSNNASVAQGACAVTFTSPLAPEVGPGDEIVFGGGLLYIRTVDGPNAVTVDVGATATHVTEDVMIRRAYNDIGAWESAREGDLVAADRAEIGIVRRDGPLAGGITIDGSITDPTHWMWLVGYESHHGHIDTGVLLDGLGIQCHGFDIQDDFVRISNLEMTRFRATVRSRRIHRRRQQRACRRHARLRLRHNPRDRFVSLADLDDRCVHWCHSSQQHRDSRPRRRA